jgi:hypothetical protein
MGLMIHSLEGLSDKHNRDYFIYLLDYGWDEPLSDALRKNFSQMANLASENKNSVVIMGTLVGSHFSDEVLSWHSFNGEEVEKEQLLPAILVTNRHPAEFRKRGERENERAEDDLKMILFPLKKHCKNTTEVVSLIQQIFNSIKLGKDLDNFGVAKEKKKGIGGAFASSIMLEPNFAGMGFSFNKFVSYFKDK